MKTFPGNGVYLTQVAPQLDEAAVKPCPFCAAEYPWLTVERGGYIHCVRCGADGPEVSVSHREGAYDTLRLALPAWNKRP